MRSIGSGQASTCLLVQRTHGARSLLNHDALLLALRASQLPCTWNVLEPVSDNAPGEIAQSRDLLLLVVVVVLVVIVVVGFQILVR